jgi:chorismate synthase
MNSFGKIFSFTTFGESHGEAIGAIIDGVPAGLKIDLDYIQAQLDRRKPGSNEFSTQRKEADQVKILSGVFEGITTGTSIGMVIYNTNAKSKDYSNIKDIFRPGHADFTYFNKYGIRDYRGGGRSSARETAMRVAVGAVAKLILKEFNIEVQSGVSAIKNIKANEIDFEYAKTSPIYSLDKNLDQQQQDVITQAKKEHNSVGGSVVVKAIGVPVGLGEPLYYKLDGTLADAMMGINAVKGVEIGDGINSVENSGYDNNDQITKDGFKSNHSGGILGGISNGEDIDITVHFKATPSIFISQDSIDINNNEVDCNLQGRHDPCVAIRGSVVCEAMASIVLVDMLLLNSTRTMNNLKKIYN